MNVVWTVLEGLGFELTTFLSQVTLFFVLHGTLNFLVYQPIMDIRNLRDRKIATGLATAEAAAAEARSLKSEYEEKVRNARAEGQIAILKATEEAEAQRKERVDRARAEAAKILQAARDEADAILAKAEETLDVQSEAVAKAIATRLLNSSLGKVDGEAIAAKLGGAR